MIQTPSRRDVVLAGAALSLAGARAAAQTPAIPPARATGIVRDEAGAGLPDVLVSNGRDVVRTDADGRYEVSLAPGETLFVVKPSGFALPTDPETGLARFSYVHDPDGTPSELGLRYRGLPPSGPLPASIDFRLLRRPEPTRFEVLLLTDPQPESSEEIAYVRDAVVCGLVGSSAAFGMTLGDIAFDDLSAYPRLNRIFGRIGVPWWTVGGNHDLDYEAPDARRARDTYKRVFGAPYYAHAYGGALFVMLDNVEYQGLASAKPGDGRGRYRGAISADQLAFVRNLLAQTPRQTLIVLAMHIPLRTYIDPEEPSQNTVNAADLLALLEDRPAVSFAGHTHSTEHHYLGAADGVRGPVPHHHHVLTAASGSWWSGPRDHRGIACADSYDGTPNGHHVLAVDGAAYTTRYVAASEPVGRQMRISLESQYRQDDRRVERDLSEIDMLRSPITVEQVAGTRLVVNVFDGGPKTLLEAAIGSFAPIAMTRVARHDPFIEQVYGRNPEAMKSWVKPQLSSHLWQAPLPAGLARGAHTIEIRVRDEYGRAHRDAMILEVV